MIFKYYIEWCCKDLKMIWEIGDIRLSQRANRITVCVLNAPELVLHFCPYCGQEIKVMAWVQLQHKPGVNEEADGD